MTVRIIDARCGVGYVPLGFCTTGANVVVFAVGAVYDRATFASEWAKCAVIDRAYNLSHRQSHV